MAMEIKPVMENAFQSQHAESRVTDMHRVAIHLDNSDFWLEIDRSVTELGWVIVPVPHFFSSEQIIHMVDQAAIDCVWCDAKGLLWWQSIGFFGDEVDKGKYFLVRQTVAEKPLPVATHKITFTSGTTSAPKGVCLSLEHLTHVGESLAQATANMGLTKHISLLPYSVLLENMAAVYANQYAHLEVISLPLSQVGLTGSGQLDVKIMWSAIVEHQADSMIMMPQMLKQLVHYLSAEPQDVSFIKFVAIGGAVCSAQLLQQAQDMGLPVYQGYGISECGSVICLNNSNEAIGSVGKALPHCQFELTDEGEIRVQGPKYLGYLGQANSEKQTFEFLTGDMGRIDQAGRLFITGRKKNLIINSFGRNILPDWIEGELLTIDGVHQAVIFGEAKPFLSALCVTSLSEQKLTFAISELNKKLPDYAQLKSVHKVAPFTPANGQLTSSGKLKHPQIFKHYHTLLETIYASSIETTTH